MNPLFVNKQDSLKSSFRIELQTFRYCAPNSINELPFIWGTHPANCENQHDLKLHVIIEHWREMMNFKYCNEVEKEVSLACLYLPTRLFGHCWSSCSVCKVKQFKIIEVCAGKCHLCIQVEVLVEGNFRELKR